MVDEKIQALGAVNSNAYVSSGEAKGANNNENSVSIFNYDNENTVNTNKVKDPDKTTAAIKKEINAGNAEYVGAFRAAFRQMDRHKHLNGAVIMLSEVPAGCETLGDIKRKFNLPDGCLRNNILKGMGGGDFDKFKAYPPISIHVETLAEGLGVTVDEIKAWFNEK